MTTALLVIDMQMEMAHRTEAGRDRANPQAEAHVADLLTLFRARSLPVIHVHHSEPGMSIAAVSAEIACSVARSMEVGSTLAASATIHRTD